MTAGTQFVVKLDVRKRGTYVSARSADVPGLHLVDATEWGLRQRALKAVPLLLKANRHLTVTAAPTDDLSEIKVTVC